MGACISARTIRTTLNIREAFRLIQDEFKHEYGHTYDNGTLSTCSLTRTRSNEEKYTKTKADRIIKSINEDDIPKRDAWGYSLGIDGYEVTTSKLEKRTNKPKFQKGYIVTYSSPNNIRDISEKEFFDKKVAEDFALKQGLKGSSIVNIDISYNLVSGNACVGSVRTTTKTYKSKPKNIKPNEVCKPIYVYYFIGLAAE